VITDHDIPPEVLKLAKEVVDRQAAYDALYATLDDAGREEEDRRRVAAAAAFVMDERLGGP